VCHDGPHFIELEKIMSLTRFLSCLGLLALLALPARSQDSPAQKKQPAVKLDQAGDPLPAGAVARLGTTRFRHQNLVSFVGYSGDGGLLVTLSGESSLRFWDARSGKEVRRLELKVNRRRFMFGGAPAVLLSGDGKTLVFGVEEGDCTVVDVATGKTLKEFKLARADGGRNRFGDEFISADQLSHDGRLLLIVDGDGGGGGKLSVWDTSTGKPVRQLDPKDKGDSFAAATLSRDGKTLVCVEGQNQNDKKPDKGEVPGKPQIRFISLTDSKDGKVARSIPSPDDFIGELALTADGKYLLVGDGGGRNRRNGRNAQTSRLVDAATGKEVRRFSAKEGLLRGVFLSPDHKTLFVACFKQITQYDLKSGNELRAFAMPPPQQIDDFSPYGRSNRFSLAIAPDGRTLAVPAEATVAFWDVQTGKELPVDQGHRNRIDSVAFGPVPVGAGLSLRVLTGSADGGLFLWDCGTDLNPSYRRIREFVPKTRAPDEEPARRGGGGERIDLFRVRGAFSPDGKTIAGLWWGDKVYIWDAASGQLKHQLGDSRGHTSFSHSPDGRFIALAGVDGTIGLWNAEAGRRVKTLGLEPKAEPMDPERDPDFDRFGQGAYSTVFSADGRMLIAGGMQMAPRGLNVQIKYLEIASGQERLNFQTRMNFEGGGGQIAFDSITSALDSFVVRFMFTPDGKSIVEAGFSNVKLRNLRTGAEIRAFGGKHVAANTALFSPDGKMLIAGKHDGTLRVWDVDSGTVLVDFPAHPSHVTALAFSPDGKRLASGARDAGLLIWDWDYIRRRALAGNPQSPPVLPDPLWEDLARKDASAAYSAVKSLAAAPSETVAFLKARLRPVPPVAPQQLKKLLDDLDNAQYATRQKADDTLQKLGDVAAQAIKDRRSNSPSVETARRLEALQKKLDAQVIPLDVLQSLRAIEVLELIASPEAREILNGLANGAPGHRITEEAKGSLRRLAPKAAAGP
jgi:WD40 repeat protein